MLALSFFLVFLMLVFSALLAAIETAITASSPGRLAKLKKQYPEKISKLISILKNKDQVISSILIGNNIMVITSTTFATTLLIKIFGEEFGTIISSFIMSVLVIIFAEVIPKAIAVVHAETIALFSASLIITIMKVLTPINIVVKKILHLFCLIFRINLQQEISGTDELRGVIEHHHNEGNFVKSDRDMLSGILDIKDVSLEEIMIHKSDVLSIDADLPMKEVCPLALNSVHSRIPIWQEKDSNIIGILNVRDLLTELHKNSHKPEKIDLKSLLSAPWFVPDNASGLQQLHAFRKQKNHFACVVNEYGDWNGIVTLEDVLEEIVGQIYDERDKVIDKVIKKSEHEFIVEGSVTIRDINKELDWSLSDEHANTIAGFVTHHIERIPEIGEKFTIDNLNIEIIKKTANRIKLMRILLPKATKQDEA